MQKVNIIKHLKRYRGFDGEQLKADSEQKVEPPGFTLYSSTVERPKIVETLKQSSRGSATVLLQQVDPKMRATRQATNSINDNYRIHRRSHSNVIAHPAGARRGISDLQIRLRTCFLLPLRIPAVCFRPRRSWNSAHRDAALDRRQIGC
ncbi:unnamed protein product [Nesidiocoris tenuis]|uniref:Uncharacterized protein n=1 Tax=Nesidiocoris tenuis TaxID=355587 RepID=A0A6H5H4Q6_9HEMI|nr:unnamed protein product [Nesidiocoris tenuis]CAB0012456.1 unnamed protein product [Nesidiocoris tenuis]